MTTTLDVLVAARELISEPERWTQRTSARDEHGNKVSPTSPVAARWCADGALWRAAHRLELAAPGSERPNPLYEAALEVLKQRLGGDLCYLHEWNDSRSHGDVLALFDRAIAAERKRGEQ